MAERRPLPELRGADEKTGEVVIYHPSTGKQLLLTDATAAQLAEWKKEIQHWRSMADAAESYVDRELIARMDREALWTFRGDGWKLTGASPKPTVSYREPEKLRARLLKLAAEGLITEAAVDAALPLVPAKVQVNVGPLGKLEKLGGRVARAVKDYRVSKPKHNRGVRVS